MRHLHWKGELLLNDVPVGISFSRPVLGREFQRSLFSFGVMEKMPTVLAGVTLGIIKAGTIDWTTPIWCLAGTAFFWTCYSGLSAYAEVRRAAWKTDWDKQ